MDLDRFKLVNDSNGHAAGDLVLRFPVERLMGRASDKDTACCSGGDEFLFLYSLINFPVA